MIAIPYQKRSSFQLGFNHCNRPAESLSVDNNMIFSSDRVQLGYRFGRIPVK